MQPTMRMFLLTGAEARVSECRLRGVARSGGDILKSYLRVNLDDPNLSEPISAALFPSEDGSTAQFVWSRRWLSTA